MSLVEWMEVGAIDLSVNHVGYYTVSTKFIIIHRLIVTGLRQVRWLFVGQQGEVDDLYENRIQKTKGGARKKWMPRNCKQLEITKCDKSRERSH